MYVYEKNLAKLSVIADTTTSNIALISAESLWAALVEVERLHAAIVTALESRNKLKEAAPHEEEEVDTEEEE